MIFFITFYNAIKSDETFFFFLFFLDELTCQDFVPLLVLILDDIKMNGK